MHSNRHDKILYGQNQQKSRVMIITYMLMKVKKKLFHFLTELQFLSWYQVIKEKKKKHEKAMLAKTGILDPHTINLYITVSNLNTSTDI